MQSLLKRRRLLLFAAGSLLAAAVVAFGTHLWYENGHYITTENAAVAGSMVQVSSSNPGRIFSLIKDVGDVVEREDSLAIVDIPIATGLSQGGTRTFFLDAQDRLAPVPSPVQGVVVDRKMYAVDKITARQTRFTLVDTWRLRVVANVEETRIAEIHAGQPVEVFVDALNRTVPGTVDTIIPASTSTFSLLPAQNAAGNFTKVVQLVPVKITVHTEAPLIVGASARVRIQVQ